MTMSLEQWTTVIVDDALEGFPDNNALAKACLFQIVKLLLNLSKENGILTDQIAREQRQKIVAKFRAERWRAN